MKTDYQLCIDFCEAEIVKPSSPIATVKDRGTFFAIVLHEIWPEIILYKPWRATAFDKARESFAGNDKTPYVEFRAWETLAKLLGLKPAWVACADRLPEMGGVYLVVDDGGDVWLGRYSGNRRSWEAGNITHWQPLPARP